MTTVGTDSNGATARVAHLAPLDGLRGVAILLVVAYHFYDRSAINVEHSTARIDTLVAHVFEVGWSGVDLFFVLSGFLITGILIDARSSARYFRNFYARRVLRIFPVYYGFLFFLIVLLPLVPALRDDPDLAILRHHQVVYWGFFYNLWLPLHPLTNIGFFGNGTIWSLAIEEQFYIVWPAIVLVSGRRGLAVICVTCVALALVVRIGLVNGAIPSMHNIFAAMTLVPARMDTLALGALLALAVRSGRLEDATKWARPAGALALAVLTLVLLTNGGLKPYDAQVQTIGFSGLAILYAAILTIAVASTRGDLVHTVLTIRPLTFLGRYSYALYIFHLQIALLLSRGFAHVGLMPDIAGSAVPARLAFTVFGAGCSVMAAWLCWYLYERHFLSLKRFFPYGERRSTQTDDRLVLQPSRALVEAEPALVEA